MVKSMTDWLNSNSSMFALDVSLMQIKQGQSFSIDSFLNVITFLIDGFVNISDIFILKFIWVWSGHSHQLNIFN